MNVQIKPKMDIRTCASKPLMFKDTMYVYSRIRYPLWLIPIITVREFKYSECPTKGELGGTNEPQCAIPVYSGQH